MAGQQSDYFALSLGTGLPLVQDVCAMCSSLTRKNWWNMIIFVMTTCLTCLRFHAILDTAGHDGSRTTKELRCDELASVLLASEANVTEQRRVDIFSLASQRRSGVQRGGESCRGGNRTPVHPQRHGARGIGGSVHRLVCEEINCKPDRGRKG